MISSKLDPNQISMLKEREGTFSQFDNNGLALADMKLIDIKPLPLGRFFWKINEAGLEVISELE